jgi:uncharacterized repeat protein (TIGR01451 family)
MRLPRKTILEIVSARRACALLSTATGIFAGAKGLDVPIKKTITNLFVMVFLCLTIPPAMAASNGDLYTNVATLKYDGNTQGQTATNIVTYFDEELAGAPGPPTEILLACEIEPECHNLVVENVSGQVLGSLTAVDGDQVGGHVFTVLDDIRFEVVDGKLKLKADDFIDFETEQSIVITIRAVDNAGNTYDEALTISVRNVNEAPTGLAIDSLFVAPNSPGGTIGNVTFTDPDQADEHVFTIAGDDRFVIVDGVLSLVPGVSLPENTNIPITITVTDKGGLSASIEVLVTTNSSEPATPSVIQFVAPDPIGNSVDIAPASCAPAPNFGVATSNSRALNSDIAGADPAGRQPLNSVGAYAIGDPVIISVADADQNFDPLVRESVFVRVQAAASSDTENVVLVESGENTGVFVGYVYTTSQESVADDCILTVSPGDSIDAIYTDLTDGNSTRTTLAEISPIGVVFNDTTGEVMQGVVISLINTDTNQPAEVRGDGPIFAGFPSAVVSGESVTDSAGATYVHGLGEYRFPSIAAGTYRLEIFNSLGWELSTKKDADLQSLGAANARSLVTDDGFVINPISRGEIFHTAQGSLVRVDIPVRIITRDVPPESLTRSTIEFLQFSSNAAFGESINVGATQCLGGINPQVAELQGIPVPVPGIVNLLVTRTVKAGQPVFIRVTDLDQNSDPLVREQISIQLDVPASGDREFLKLMETGVDTGTFVGYVQTTENESTVGSCMLGVVKNGSIVTRYTDAFDNTDVANATILVDPFGKVFSTRDGELLDGVRVTLVDMATGQPAQVFGDGPDFADYPSTMLSGSSVTDAAGNIYQLPMGEYRFPFVDPGNYQLVVGDLPVGGIFPTTLSDADIQGLPGGPFELVDGSRGEAFEVPVGPALHIDLPVDEPSGVMFISKEASKASVAIGDFLQYRLSVSNTAGTRLTQTHVLDRLPVGFRYQTGSLQINDEKVADPVMTGDARMLKIDLPAISGDAINIKYVTEVTTGANVGAAVNEASVVGELVASTNVATARVLVTNDLFRDKAILVGQVSLEQCQPVNGKADKANESANDKSAKGGATKLVDGDQLGTKREGRGVAGVRVYLEDGSYVITDDKGFWHIEGVEPGTHVVQLDVDSLAERYEASPCNVNTRFAGSNYSQFVDVQGGTLWRADFLVQEKAPPESTLTLTQTIKVDNDGLWVGITADNEGRVEITDTNAIYRVPAGWVIVPGSGTLDGDPLTFSSSIVGTIWPLGTVIKSKELRFALEPKDKIAVVSPQKRAGNQIAVLRPRFKSRSIVLSEADLSALDDLIKTWQGQIWAEISVVGHTDNVRVAPSNRSEFANNEVLAAARARVVAEYIQGKVDADVISVVGAGDRYPVASNATANGREQNRRVEFMLRGAKIAAEPQKNLASAKILNGESSVRLSFRSVGSPKGMTKPNSLPLNRIVGGFDTLNASVKTQAIGSWDALELVAASPLIARDPDAQGLISMVDGTRLAKQTNAVKFDMDSRLTPKLLVDGVVVPNDRIGFRMEDETTGKTLYSYIGVNFGEPGAHQILLQGTDGFGIARFEEIANVVRVGEIFSIRIKDTAGNVADGVTPVRLQVELRDKAGELINDRTRLAFDSDTLRFFDQNQSLSELSVITEGNYVTVDADGVLMFNPVSRGGSYQVTLRYNLAEEDVDIFVEPEKRDWIMVGIAEGTLAHNTLSGNMQGLEAAGLEDELDTSGRVAFYAKGQVRGDYVLTMAYDSDKETNNAALGQVIDPSSFYTLYGDQSAVQRDAASQDKLYLKLEKTQFFALFGDFNTALQGGELSAYSRSMNGLQSEYQGEVFEYSAFLSEADQAFIRDEIRGDGTSGIYRMRNREVVINSERVLIQTRDRFRSEEILETREMRRFVDYNIDYEAGTLFFKEPIFSQDSAFNPTFIIADYEVAGDGSNQINAGGRIGYRPIEDLEIGATLVTEGVKGRENKLLGTDLEYRINDTTQVRAEIATSTSEFEGETINGTAYIAEITHRDEALDATAYLREQQGGFGLGQQNSSETGTRKMGVETTYDVTENIGLQGEVFRQTALATGANQDVATSTMNYQGDNFSLSSGLRTAMTNAGEEDAVSNQLLLGGSYDILEGKARLSANADTPIGGQNSVGNFPSRLRVGLDYKLTEDITLNAQQEFTFGEDQDTQGSRIGMTSSLWEGGDLVTSVQRDDQENSQRLAAVAGLKQRWDMNDNWSFDFGVDRSQTFQDEQRAVPDLQVTTVFNSPSNNDFTAVTFGSRFREGPWDWATRVEYRAADNEDKMNFVSDVIHNLDDGQQLLAKVNVQTSKGENRDAMSSLVQVGYAYRPEESRWSMFNRLDMLHSSSNAAGFGLRTNKIVNNMNANYLLGDDTQIALQYGLKYVVDNFDSDEYSGFTDLYGMELRHDMGENWDIGVQGGRYSSSNSNVADYTYGVSFGYTVTRNVWLSLGYNFDGFQDEDFSESEYTSEGVFVKYRFKFDQYSARDLKSRFWD